MEELIRKVLDKTEFAWFTTVVDFEDYQVLKQGWRMAIRRYEKEIEEMVAKDMEFWKLYEGLSAEKSARINNVLKQSIFDGTWRNKNEVVSRIMQVSGIDKERAEIIATTELAEFANRVREMMYRERTKVVKFVWVTEKDDRVCEKCKEMERRCAGGVSLDEMKMFVKELGGREWILHPLCRCSFIRKYYKTPRYWEIGWGVEV